MSLFSVRKSCFGSIKNKTPESIDFQGFLLVDKRFEISNLDLLRDFSKVIGYMGMQEIL